MKKIVEITEFGNAENKPIEISTISEKPQIWGERDNMRTSTLKETAEMMQSADYKERFIAEYEQNRIRRAGLKNMLNKWDEGTIDFVPTCPRSIYDLQIRAMNDYITVLEARAAIEGIDINCELF